MCYGTVADRINVKVFENFDELAPMQQEWDSFVESAGGEIFLTYDWCRIWWKYYGKNRILKVFMFRDNGILVGIIPLFFEKLRFGPLTVRAAKIVGSDFTLTQFSPPLAEGYTLQVIKRVSELISKDNCDIIHIGPIAGLYSHCDELKESLTESFGNYYSVQLKNKDVQTYFKLADDWDAQLAGLSKKERSHIKQSYKYAAKLSTDNNNGIISSFSDDGDLEKTFNEFVQMHQSQWSKLGNAGHFGDWPKSRGFHYEIARAQLQKGRLRLLKVSIGEQDLGYEYGYKFGDTYCWFLNARQEIEGAPAGLSFGKVMFSEFMKRALSEKVRYIDGLVGKYEYKLQLGGQLFQIKNIYIIPRKITSRLRVFLLRLCARLLNVCYYKIWYCRIAPRLPYKKKGLWEVFIKLKSFS